MTGRFLPKHTIHPLLGAVVKFPGTGCRGFVLNVEHEGDDGTTLRYLDGPYAGKTTTRDTFSVWRWERIAG